ncbi:Fc.00g056200.m01.CDS01 [Cosmosporella sp. VM-42]
MRNTTRRKRKAGKRPSTVRLVIFDWLEVDGMAPSTAFQETLLELWPPTEPADLLFSPPPPHALPFPALSDWRAFSDAILRSKLIPQEFWAELLFLFCKKVTSSYWSTPLCPPLHEFTIEIEADINRKPLVRVTFPTFSQPEPWTLALR